MPITPRFPARLTPHVQIALWLGVLAVAVNVILSALTPTPILRWLPRVVAGTGYFEDSRQRVDDAMREYREGRIASDDHLAAIVGLSGVRQGIELRVVSESVGDGWHVLGLGGAGLGIYDVAPYADLVLSSDLRPDLVVLGIGLYQMLDTRPKPGSTTMGLFDYLRQGDLRNTAIALRDSTWVYARRQDVNLATQSALLESRAKLFGAFGVALSQQETAQRSPWREMIKDTGWPEHFSEATLREEEQFFAQLGVFERATYESAPKATAILTDLIERFQRQHAEVIIVLMPEQSTLQRKIPPEALDIVQGHLRQTLANGLPRTLDFRRSIDDSGFVDLAHLNRSGSLRFSQLLATSLQSLLPDKPSLMARPRVAVAPVGSRGDR